MSSFFLTFSENMDPQAPKKIIFGGDFGWTNLEKEAKMIECSVAKKTEKFARENKEAAAELQKRMERITEEKNEIKKELVKNDRIQRGLQQRESAAYDGEKKLKKRMEILVNEEKKIKWERAGLVAKEGLTKREWISIHFSLCDVCVIINEVRADCRLANNKMSVEMLLCKKCFEKNGNKKLDNPKCCGC